MIFDPLPVARLLSEFPVYCPSCRHTFTINSLEDSSICALVERTYETEWNHERELLFRLKALIQKYPHSLHRDKVRVTTWKAGPNNQYYEVLDSRPANERKIITRRIEHDPEFEAALNADPELRDWLKHTSFLLYSRLEMFAKKEDCSEKYQDEKLRCPRCHHDHVAIDTDFFNTLA